MDFSSYPMPRLDNLISHLGRAQFISMLDLTKGYLQVPLMPEAKPKTTLGHWQYLVLLFGLHRVPVTFQTLMDVVLYPPP